MSLLSLLARGRQATWPYLSPFICPPPAPLAILVPACRRALLSTEHWWHYTGPARVSHLLSRQLCREQECNPQGTRITAQRPTAATAGWQHGPRRRQQHSGAEGGCFVATGGHSVTQGKRTVTTGERQRVRVLLGIPVFLHCQVLPVFSTLLSVFLPAASPTSIPNLVHTPLFSPERPPAYLHWQPSSRCLQTEYRPAAAHISQISTALQVGRQTGVLVYSGLAWREVQRGWHSAG